MRPMRASLVPAAALLGAALLGPACAATPDPTVERLRALSPEARSQFDKYRQFMTDLQIARYLMQGSDADRAKFIASLGIEQRLTKYPPHVQQAIWDRKVVPGMDTEAVFLAWGRPDERDRADPRKTGGNAEETWRWERVSAERKAGIATVRILNGMVVDVVEFEPTE